VGLWGLLRGLGVYTDASDHFFLLLFLLLAFCLAFCVAFLLRGLGALTDATDFFCSLLCIAFALFALEKLRDVEGHPTKCFIAPKKTKSKNNHQKI